MNITKLQKTSYKIQWQICCKGKEINKQKFHPNIYNCLHTNSTATVHISSQREQGVDSLSENQVLQLYEGYSKSEGNNEILLYDWQHC